MYVNRPSENFCANFRKFSHHKKKYLVKTVFHFRYSLQKSHTMTNHYGNPLVTQGSSHPFGFFGTRNLTIVSSSSSSSSNDHKDDPSSSKYKLPLTGLPSQYPRLNDTRDDKISSEAAKFKVISSQDVPQSIPINITTTMTRETDEQQQNCPKRTRRKRNQALGQDDFQKLMPQLFDSCAINKK